MFSQIVFSEIFNDFKIIGNERVSKQTIINFTEINVNDDLNQEDLNNVLKRLYDTNFFEDISVNLENAILSITVKEFPIINNIQFNGVKTEKLKKQLFEAIVLKEKSPFNKLPADSLFMLRQLPNYRISVFDPFNDAFGHIVDF